MRTIHGWGPFYGAATRIKVATAEVGTDRLRESDTEWCRDGRDITTKPYRWEGKFSSESPAIEIFGRKSFGADTTQNARGRRQSSQMRHAPRDRLAAVDDGALSEEAPIRSLPATKWSSSANSQGMVVHRIICWLEKVLNPPILFLLNSMRRNFPLDGWDTHLISYLSVPKMPSDKNQARTYPCRWTQIRLSFGNSSNSDSHSLGQTALPKSVVYQKWWWPAFEWCA